MIVTTTLAGGLPRRAKLCVPDMQCRDPIGKSAPESGAIRRLLSYSRFVDLRCFLWPLMRAALSVPLHETTLGR